MDGALNLDKPAGMTSARAVDRVKRLLPRGTKVGHAGTLDPFATGVLVLLIGRATKQCERFMSEPKRYVATIKLGATTETLDPESPEAAVPLAPPGSAPPTAEAVREVLARFVGEVRQVPPQYSALKVGGRPAYDRARAGEVVALEARPVRIYGIELGRYEYPLAEVTVDCGRGTYIRALARDVGAALGTAGYLTALRRTRVGPFTVEDAARLEELVDAAAVAGRLVPVGG